MDKANHEGNEVEEEQDKEDTLASDLVVTKYSAAAEIVNAVLQEVLSAIKPGVEIGFLCDLGDRLILEKTSKIFKKEKDLTKGIAMPTCISVDNIICHYSPLTSDPPVPLKNGQMVKVDLGAHIDGFIATAAHTVVVGASKDEKVTGSKANVILAAYNAMETSIRMLRPGAYKNVEVTSMIDKVAAIYKVKPIENMLSYQLKRHKIDGDKQIIQNPGDTQKNEVEKCTFDKYEAYAIDILMSTGEGKGLESGCRTTVYKKVEDVIYSLKIKLSRQFFSSAMGRFGSMPFSIRSFENETQAKLGVNECERHGLLQPYPVLREREGEYVAQFKCTVLVLPNRILKIAGLPIDLDLLQSDLKIEDETITNLLNSSLRPKKGKKKSGSQKADEVVSQKNEKAQTMDA